MEDFEKSADLERTKLVAITHMSNALGTITPIKEIVEDRPRAKTSRCWSTAARAAVHLPVDVQRYRLRFLMSSPATRSTAPPASACSTARSRHAGARCGPSMGGGEMIFDVTEDEVTYNDPPHRFEAGTPPIVQAIGLGAPRSTTWIRSAATASPRTRPI
jgi:cysteine desulfurase/selenocysteine lyase